MFLFFGDFLGDSTTGPPSKTHEDIPLNTFFEVFIKAIQRIVELLIMQIPTEKIMCVFFFQKDHYDQWP